MRSETPPPPPSPGTDDDRPAASPPRGTFIVLMILVTAALFAVMVSLLFYNWATSREPSSVMVVEGTAKFDGTVVTIEGVGLDHPYTGTLSADRNYHMPFYLDRGIYTIRLTQGGRTLMQTDFQIGTREGKKLSLLGHDELLDPASTRPATKPGR